MNGIMWFNEGERVGKVSEYKTPEEFVIAVNEECDDDIDVSKVKRIYVRHVPKAPLWFDGAADNVYITCEKGKGAFECFIVE